MAVQQGRSERDAEGGTYQSSLEPLASIKCERIVTLPPVSLDRYVEALSDARTKVADFFSVLPNRSMQETA
jgi:hypothetical protein